MLLLSTSAIPSLCIGKGMASADTEIEVIAQALSDSTGPVTVFTDSVAAIDWLSNGYPGPVPEAAADPRSRYQPRAPHRMDQGTYWHPQE